MGDAKLSFGKMLREIRRAKGFTLAEAASTIGVSLTYFADVEKGRRNAFPDDRIEAIARAWKLSQVEGDGLLASAAKSRGVVEIPANENTVRLAALLRKNPDTALLERIIRQLGGKHD